MNYYKTLAVVEGASFEEVKAAYRKLAKQYHPDRNPGDKEAFKKFNDVKNAYDALKGVKPKTPPQKKEEPKSEPVSENLTPTIFGSVNLMVQLNLHENEFLNGTVKDITIDVPTMCFSCGGDGKHWTPCKCTMFSGTKNEYTLAAYCPICQGQGEILTSCKDCKNTGINGTKPKKFCVKIKPKSFIGMQLNFAGEGLMIKGRNGSLRIVLLKH